MERSLNIERLYSLGNFSKVTFQEEVTGIPEKLVLNEAFVTALSTLIMLRIEQSYYKYVKLMEDHKGKSVDDIVIFLEELRLNELENLKQFIETEKE